MMHRTSSFGVLPEVVRDSELTACFETRGEENYTIHPRSRSRRERNSQDEWLRKRKLGSGSFGLVELQERKSDSWTNSQYRAVKTIRVWEDDTEQRKLIVRELEALFKFSNPKYSELFVRSFGWFTSPYAVHIAMEYYELGDLQNYLSNPSKCPNGQLLERDMHAIASQVLDALDMMHGEGFSHRDLKPANILIDNHPPEPWSVKLSDFGISQRGGEVTKITQIRGTLSFMPPELRFGEIRGTSYYPYAADMWCLGEIICRGLTGQPLFTSTKLVGFYEGRIDFPETPLLSIQASPDAISFIKSLIVSEPTKRLNTMQALKHPWINIKPGPFWVNHTNESKEKTTAEVEAGLVEDEDTALWPTIFSDRFNPIQGEVKITTRALVEEATAGWPTSTFQGISESLDNQSTINMARDADSGAFDIHLEDNPRARHNPNMIPTQTYDPTFGSEEKKSNECSINSINLFLDQNGCGEYFSNEDIGRPSHFHEQPLFVCENLWGIEHNPLNPHECYKMVLSTHWLATLSHSGIRIWKMLPFREPGFWQKIDANDTIFSDVNRLSKLSALEFSSDGLTMAVAGSNKVWIWQNVEAKDGSVCGFRLTRILQWNVYNITSISFSPDGRWLATTSSEIRLYSIDTNSEAQWPMCTLSGYRDALNWAFIQVIQFSSDSQHLLAVTPRNLEVVIWKRNTYSYQHLRTIQIAAIAAGSPIQLHPTLRWFISKSSPTTVLITGIAAETQICEPFELEVQGDSEYLGCGGDITSMAISPDGNHLALLIKADLTSNNLVEIWAMMPQGHPQFIQNLQFQDHGHRAKITFGRDGRLLAVGQDFGQFWSQRIQLSRI